MRAGNLSKGILEPSGISISSVLGQLSVSFLEYLGLLKELGLRMIQLHFLIDGSFFKPRHLELSCHNRLFLLDDPGSQGQDFGLKLDDLLTLVMKPFGEVLFILAEVGQLLL